VAHDHDWHVGAYVVPEEGEQLKKVEPARHPATGKPFDLSQKKDREFAKELGVDVDTTAPPREHKVIFDCACGETRHVPMTKQGVERVHAALDSGEVPGRIPAEELVEAMPS
jgi:hypothetical protein